MVSPWEFGEGFVVEVRCGMSLLICSKCYADDYVGVVSVLGSAVWAVTDLMMAMDTHRWAHQVSQKQGVPMSEFVSSGGLYERGTLKT